MSRRRFPRRILRERNRQGAFCGQLHHRHGAGTALGRARRMSCCTITWATSTIPWAPGGSRGAAWAQSATRSATPSKPAAARSAVAAPVAQILVKNGRASGVLLDDGEQIHAPFVLSNMDVRRTFLKSMGREGVARRIPGSGEEFQESAGRPAKLNIAARRPARAFRPYLTGARARARHACHRYIEMMERAYDDWKEGRWSRAPYISHVDPVPDRSLDGPRRQALHDGLRNN